MISRFQRRTTLILLMMGGMWAALIVVLIFFTARGGHAAWDRVAQEWEPYRLNEQQRQWFKTVRPNRKGPACCDIADGHPTQAEHRADGWYIPNYYHPDHDWIKVPEEAMTTPGTNPVGVATVWFGSQNEDGTPYVRCFVPEAET